jgi:hypothetical protein
VNGLAALPALLRPFVLNHMLVKPTERRKTPAAEGAVVLGIEFVIVTEHGQGI